MLKNINKQPSKATVGEEIFNILLGRCFRPIADNMLISDALEGKPFTCLHISIAMVTITKLIYKNGSISVVGTKAFPNDKTQDFVSFASMLFSKESFISELSFGSGILISVLPNEFKGETISPSQMHIPMSKSAATRNIKFCNEISDPALQAKWLEYWLDRDPSYTVERCVSALPVNSQFVYRAMYLPVINEFVLGALPREIVNLVHSLSRFYPILGVSYLPFQLIGLGHTQGLFQRRVSTEEPQTAPSTDAPQTTTQPQENTEYSGLWGIYFFDHIITFAWRKLLVNGGNGFFGSVIKYCPPQPNQSAMQSNMDAIFRESAAFFVKNVLRTSSTIRANSADFKLYCTDADTSRKSLLLPILQNSLMRPATPFNWDDNKYNKLFGYDSRLNPEMKFYLNLQLGI